jgi:hypothetical protein
MSMKNSNDTIGNRSRDLPVCSAVPQPLRHRAIDNTLDIKCFNKTIGNFPYTNFLCLVPDDPLNWDDHIDQLISILNSACNAVTAVTTMLSRKALRTLYFSYVHTLQHKCL